MSIQGYAWFSVYVGFRVHVGGLGSMPFSVGPPGNSYIVAYCYIFCLGRGAHCYREKRT